MSQQVNLFNTLSRPSKYYLTELLILQILGGFIFVLIVVTGLQIFLLQKQKHTFKTLQETFLSREAAFENLSRQSSEVTKISEELEQKAVLLQSFQAQKVTSGKCASLSHYFTALSEMPVSGLWFKHIFINLVEDKIVLAGSTYTPALLIQLVENLNHTTCFADRDFGPLKLNKEEGQTSQGLLDFSISAKTPSSPMVRLA